MTGTPDERGTAKGPFQTGPIPQPLPTMTPFPLSPEQRDQRRATSLGFTPTQEYASWLWPASFFEDEMGRPMWKRVTGQESPILLNDAWIRQYCRPAMNAGVPISVTVTAAGPSISWQDVSRMLLPGYIVLFSGTSWINPAQHVNHSAIATGRADEISQKWWDHDLQNDMVVEMNRARGLPKRPNIPSETLRARYTGREYPVTRSRISDLVKLFTLPVAGTAPAELYFVNAFSVFEVVDPKFAMNDEIAALALP